MSWPVAAAGAHIEIHSDQPDGPLSGICTIPDTGSSSNWKTVSCPLRSTAGVHDIFLVFDGIASASPRLDWWQVE